jgi:hypothetical protein
MQEISKIIGLVIEPDYLIPLMSGHLSEHITKASFKNIENLLIVFESSITKQSLQGISTNTQHIVSMFLSLEPILL